MVACFRGARNFGVLHVYSGANCFISVESVSSRTGYNAMHVWRHAIWAVGVALWTGIEGCWKHDGQIPVARKIHLKLRWRVTKTTNNWDHFCYWIGRSCGGDRVLLRPNRDLVVYLVLILYRKGNVTLCMLSLDDCMFRGRMRAEEKTLKTCTKSWDAHIVLGST